MARAQRVSVAVQLLRLHHRGEEAGEHVHNVLVHLVKRRQGPASRPGPESLSPRISEQWEKRRGREPSLSRKGPWMVSITSATPI